MVSTGPSIMVAAPARWQARRTASDEEEDDAGQVEPDMGPDARAQPTGPDCEPAGDQTEDEQRRELDELEVGPGEQDRR